MNISRSGDSNALINAVTVHVGTTIEMSGNATYQELRDFAATLASKLGQQN